MVGALAGGSIEHREQAGRRLAGGYVIGEPTT